nr:unnamed protein product [Callosobruchus analis]
MRILPQQILLTLLTPLVDMHLLLLRKNYLVTLASYQSHALQIVIALTLCSLSLLPLRTSYT